MKLVMKTYFGSRIYGTQVPTSDIDIKGIYLPSARDILLQRIQRTIVKSTKSARDAKNTSSDVDTELFSLDQYLKLLMDGQTVALDMLFAPMEHFIFDDVKALGVWHEIRANRAHFLHSGISSFVGYTKQQAAKYGIKGSRIAALRAALNHLDLLDETGKLSELDFHDILKHEHIAIVECRGPNGEMVPHLEVCNRKIPFHATARYAKNVFQKIFDEYGHRARLAETNQGVDFKALMHAVRVAHEAKELLLTGEITFPRPERELLLRIRKGEMAYKEVAEIIEHGLVEVENASQQSILPKQPDRAMADLLIYRAYADVIHSQREREWRELMSC